MQFDVGGIVVIIIVLALLLSIVVVGRQFDTRMVVGVLAAVAHGDPSDKAALP